MDKSTHFSKGRGRSKQVKGQVYEVKVTSVPASDADHRIARAISLVLVAAEKRYEHPKSPKVSDKRE